MVDDNLVTIVIEGASCFLNYDCELDRIQGKICLEKHMPYYCFNFFGRK